MFPAIDAHTALLLAGALVYGIVTTYYDIKTRRVPNTITLLAIAYAIAVNVATIIGIHATGGQINGKYIADQILNTLLATIVGIVFYYMDFAGPADGKMIIAYSMLLPVSIYHRGYFWPYPGITHVAVTYIIAYTYIAVKGTHNIGLTKMADKIRADILSAQTPRTFIYIIAFATILQELNRVVQTKLNSPVFVLLYVFALYHLLKKFKKAANAATIAGIVIYATRAILNPIQTIRQTIVFAAMAIGLQILFAPMQLILKESKGEKIPLALFLFAGAIVTVLLVW